MIIHNTLHCKSYMLFIDCIFLSIIAWLSFLITLSISDPFLLGISKTILMHPTLDDLLSFQSLHSYHIL